MLFFLGDGGLIILVKYSFNYYKLRTWFGIENFDIRKLSDIDIH